MRSDWIRVSPEFSDWCPSEKGMWRHSDTETHGVKAMWWQKQGLERCSCKPRGAKDAGTQQQLGERPGVDSPSEPPETTDPADIFISQFQPLELWEWISVVLNNPVYDNVLWQP